VGGAINKNSMTLKHDMMQSEFIEWSEEWCNYWNVRLELECSDMKMQNEKTTTRSRCNLIDCSQRTALTRRNTISLLLRICVGR
jgi:hypothetical protein